MSHPEKVRSARSILPRSRAGRCLDALEKLPAHEVEIHFNLFEPELLPPRPLGDVGFQVLQIALRRAVVNDPYTTAVATAITSAAPPAT